MLLAVHQIPGVKVLRNNVGKCWMGRVFKPNKGQRVWVEPEGSGKPFMLTLGPRDKIIQNARRVEFGLIKGSGDGIGWREVEITPKMVGRTIAQFVSVETKTATGQAEDDQLTWQRNVNQAGGLAIIVRSAEEAEEELRQIHL